MDFTRSNKFLDVVFYLLFVSIAIHFLLAICFCIAMILGNHVFENTVIDTSISTIQLLAPLNVIFALALVGILIISSLALSAIDKTEPIFMKLRSVKEHIYCLKR